MNEFLSNLVQLSPGIGAGISGNGPGMQAFMEAFQRTSAMLDQREMQRQTYAQNQTDRQRQIERQDRLDTQSAEDRQRRIALEGLQVGPALAEQASAFDVPEDAKAFIEQALPGLMKVYGQDLMAQGQPAVNMATQAITGRQQRQVKEFVDSALKTSFVADNPDADPVVELPSHLQKIVGKPHAKLSELQQFAQMPIGKPSIQKTAGNPTEASLALAAAGGDPGKAFSMLNPPKNDGGGKTNYRFLKDAQGNIFEWPTDQPAPRGSRPYNETTQRQEDAKVARDESVNSAAAEALQLVRDLKTKAGLSGAVGAKGPTSLFGFLDRPMGGTNAAGYRALYDSLKSKLTIPAMQQMRGLGAMSDREFRTMSDSVTALSTEMPEAMFKAELDKIEQTLTAVTQRMQVQQAAPAMNDVGGGVRVGQFIVREKG